MSNKNDPPSAFQSIRIVSEKAKNFLRSARSRMHGKGEQSKNQNESVSFPSAQEEKREEIVVHLSIRSVVKAAFAILAIALLALFLYQIRDTLLILFLAVFLAIIIDPGVAFLERWKVPRGLAVLIVYIAAIALLMFLLISLIPIIALQIQQMAVRLGAAIDTFIADPTFRIPFLSESVNADITLILRQFLEDISTGGLLRNLQQFGQDLSNAAQGSIAFVVAVAGSVVTFVVNFIMVLVLCFFVQLEKEAILRWARIFLPYRVRRYAEGKAEAIHEKLAHWIRGQIMLSFSIGLLVFLALTILRMPYALTLGVLAFFTEFVPVVGPIAAAIPSVFIALTQFGPLPALVVAATYYGIQWCENNLLVPLVMQRAVGLSPIAIMVAMLVGVSFPETIHPVLGVLLAIPATTIFSIFVQDYRQWRTTNRE